MISTITTDQKSTALESVNLICVNTHSNANKFWSAWVLPSGDLYVEYGRQGYSPKPHFYTSPSIDASRNKLRSLIWEKEATRRLPQPNRRNSIADPIRTRWRQSRTGRSRLLGELGC
jgi:predicted DNA-binding WGR domain protein